MASRPSVLFVCVHNVGRSQTAAGFLAHLAGDAIEVRSVGSAPAETVSSAAVETMAEIGIDISGQSPKILTPHAVPTSDAVRPVRNEIRGRVEALIAEHVPATA